MGSDSTEMSPQQTSDTDDNDAATPIRAAILGKGSDGHGDAALDAMESAAAGLSGADAPARAKKSQDQESKKQGTTADSTQDRRFLRVRVRPMRGDGQTSEMV